MHGLIGEYTVDDSVWIVKSHSPARMDCLDFEANKMIVTFRNPFEVIVSQINLFYAKSHQLQIDNDIPVEDPAFWDTRIKESVRLQMAFFNHVMHIQKTQ